MKSLLSLLFLLSGIVRLSGQTRVIGRITDSNGQPIPFANVLLLNLQDSSLIKGGLADGSGKYQLDRINGGNYFLSYFAIGYQPVNSSRIELTGSREEIDLGTRVMNVDDKNQKTVRIEKPLYIHKTDRIIIDLAGTGYSKGHSGFEILESSPGIYIDGPTGTITLNEKYCIVTVNGKRVPSPPEKTIAFLHNMKADTIEKIELISTPAAVINFIWKKNSQLGTSGSFSLSQGYGYREKEDAAIEFARNTIKTGMYGSYSFSHNRTNATSLGEGYEVAPLFGGGTTFDIFNNSRSTLNSQNALLGMDVKLKKTTIGGSIRFGSITTTTNTLTNARYTLPLDSALLLDSRTSGSSHQQNIMAGLFLQKEIRDGEKFDFEIDGIKYTNSNPMRIQNSFSTKNTSQPGSNDTLLSPLHNGSGSEYIKIGIANISYAKRLARTITWEAGIKTSISQSSSLSSISSLIDNKETIGAEGRYDLLMKEGIGAAHTSFEFRLNSMTALAIGGRYEYSHTRLTDPNNKTSLNDYRLGKLLPDISYSNRINDRSGWQLSYTESLTRPSYNEILAFLNYNDPVSVDIGNPLLRPTVTKTLKAQFYYKEYWASAGLSREDHPIADVQVMSSPSGNLLYILPQNLQYRNSLTLQAHVPWKITGWWNISQEFFGGWRQYKGSFTKQDLTKTWFGYYLYNSQTFKLPQNFALELSGQYSSASYNGTVRTDAIKSVNAAISKQLKRNWGDLRFSVDDLFKSIHYSFHYGTLTEEAYSLKSHLTVNPESQLYRIYKLSYFKSFGNGQVKSHKRDLNSREEAQRISVYL